MPVIPLGTVSRHGWRRPSEHMDVPVARPQRNKRYAAATELKV